VRQQTNPQFQARWFAAFVNGGHGPILNYLFNGIWYGYFSVVAIDASCAKARLMRYAGRSPTLTVFTGMYSHQSLISELEEAIQNGAKDKRVGALRRITDLFVADSNRLNDEQIEVFDDVLCHLIKRIEAKALSELSRCLAPIQNATMEIVRPLAHDDDIDVAEPILRQSARVNDADLIEIANTKAQEHFLAISSRTRIGSSVIDALLRRGDERVFNRLVENSGASFSEDGFATLIKSARRDENLVQKIGLRLYGPSRLFRELLLRATETNTLAVARASRTGESRKHPTRVDKYCGRRRTRGRSEKRACLCRDPRAFRYDARQRSVDGRSFARSCKARSVR
jgi:hypothetical protein